jgi:N-hydroxyarylamine O-acetyltransferase
MNVDQYLARIGYAGPREPTAQALRSLHRAHLLSIPYENLDIQLGIPLTLDVAYNFRKIIMGRRGGWCHELNGLFAWLLRQLGFDVSLLSARVMNATGELGREFAHLVLLVRVEGTWLADVGFGSLFSEPLRVDRPMNNKFAGWQYRILARGDQELAVEERTQNTPWRVRYVVSLVPRQLQEFRDTSQWQQTSPDSSFVQRRMCTRLTPQGRLTLFQDKLIAAAGDVQSEVRLSGENWDARALREHFGIELPARHATSVQRALTTFAGNDQ